MRVPRVFEVSSIVLLATALAMAQPVITPSGVVNAAGAIPGGLPNTGIALGSIFLINGSGLGADNPTPMNLLQNTTFPLPSSQGLNGTTVQIKTNISSGYAILLYESATQIAAIMPSNTPYGQAAVTVTYNGQTSASAAIMVVQKQFDVFTTNGSGGGPGYIVNVNSNTDQVTNRVSRPARPGQLVYLVGTGLGAVRGDETQGTFQGDMPGLVLDLQIYVGGKPVVIDQNTDYMGRVSCCAGIDEVYFQVPRGVLGCYLPVVVVTDGLSSNTTTMSISSDGSPCSEPSVGLIGADLQTMIGNNSAREGVISLGQSLTNLVGPNGSLQSQASLGGAGFSSLTAAQFVSLPGAFPSPGGCIVTPVNAAAAPQPPVGTALDAGPVINVNGPNGSTQMAQSSDGTSYAATLDNSFLAPGSYEVDNGGGGNDVGPFQATINTPPAFTWTPQPAGESVPKNVPLLITWKGGDPNGLVLAVGLSADSTGQVGARFMCTQAASSGNLTVPVYILSWMPTNTLPISVLTVFEYVQSRFSAPGLDAGYFLYQIGQAVNVQFSQPQAKF
jgi:uncharacterized protein (TIGR03437 family)